MASSIFFDFSLYTFDFPSKTTVQGCKHTVEQRLQNILSQETHKFTTINVAGIVTERLRSVM